MGGRRPLVVIAAVVLAIFADTFPNEFTGCDDDNLIVLSAFIREPSTANIATWFDPATSRAPMGQQYLPVEQASYALDQALFGIDHPAAWHLQSILWHALASVLLFVLLRDLGAAGDAALLAATIFAIHPAQVESVAWLSGRRTAICGAFVLLATLAFARFRAGGEPRWRAYALSIAAAILANLSKQYAVVLPALLGAVDLVRPGPRPASRGTLATPYVPHVALALGFAALHIWVGIRAGIVGAARLETPTRLLTAPALLASYGRLLVCPTDLHPLRTYPTPDSPLDGRVLAGLALLAGLVAAAIAYRRRAPIVTFGIVTSLGTLAPALATPGTQLFAERYLYLPLAGAAAVAGLGLAALFARSPVAGTLATLVVCVPLGIATVERNTVWHDSVTLFADVVHKEPKHARARLSYWNALRERGRGAEAAAELRRAAELTRELLSSAAGLERQGRFAEADGQYLDAANATPLGGLEAPLALAAFRLRRGEVTRARDVLETLERIPGVDRDAVARFRAEHGLRE